MSKHRLLARLGAVLFLSALPAVTSAQNPDYPNKPVRMVVQYSPGGLPDLVGRVIAGSLSERLGQSFYVENRLGANGVIATENVATSAPDGYSLLLTSDGPIVIMPHLRSGGVDPLKALVPVNLAASTAFVLIASPGLNVSTLEDVVRLSKTRGLTIGSAGIGSQHHLAAELLKSRANIELLHVPYKGFGDAIRDVVGGRIDLLFGGVPVAAPFIENKQVVPIAVTSTKRSPKLSSVPTFIESGYPDFEILAWFGIMAPTGTPDPTLNRLGQAISVSLKSPDVIQQMDKVGAEILNGDAEMFASRIQKDFTRWSDLIRKTGLKLK